MELQNARVDSPALLSCSCPRPCLHLTRYHFVRIMILPDQYTGNHCNCHQIGWSETMLFERYLPRYIAESHFNKCILHWRSVICLLLFINGYDSYNILHIRGSRRDWRWQTSWGPTFPFKTWSNLNVHEHFFGPVKIWIIHCCGLFQDHLPNIVNIQVHHSATDTIVLISMPEDMFLSRAPLDFVVLIGRSQCKATSKPHSLAAPAPAYPTLGTGYTLASRSVKQWSDSTLQNHRGGL